MSPVSYLKVAYRDFIIYIVTTIEVIFTALITST